MAEKSLAQVSFFSPEFVDPRCLVPGSVPWMLARFGSRLFPAWLLQGWCKVTGRGRDAWPALTLLGLLVLRFSEEGMSRRASVERAKRDVAWRAALGLALGSATPGETTIRRFETFLRSRDPRSGVPRYLLVHEHLVRQCLHDERLKAEAVWATDSTPMWCYGAVRDTVRLLGDGLRMLVGRYARLAHVAVERLAGDWELPLMTSKSVKGHYAIDWSDAGQRASVIEQLAGDVVRIVEVVRARVQHFEPKHRKDLLQRCARLLQVVQQDLERDEATGRLVVARRVAQSRLISLTDPQARHGRKSKSHTFNGFKLHLVGDVVSGLIASIAVTEGNKHDARPAPRLIRRARQLCEQNEYVLGDTAYGGAELRHVVRATTGVQLVSPPPPTVAKQGRLTRKDFDVDLDAMSATCPSGHRAAGMRYAFTSEHQMHVPVFVWSKADCDACPRSRDCRGELKRGRFVMLHPFERELREARELWERPEVRRLYRTRSQCERLVHQAVRHGGRKARSFGLGAAQLQAHLIAIRCNLGVLAKQMLREERRASSTPVAA